jgi:N-acetylneuraminic acid mutarotase
MVIVYFSNHIHYIVFGFFYIPEEGRDAKSQKDCLMQKIFRIITVLLVLSGCVKNNQPPSPAILRLDPSTGAQGTYVFIYGSNFDTAASGNLVSFNGINAPVIDADVDTLLIVQAPPGVTTGKVTVSRNNQKTTSTDDFVVLPGNWIQKKDFPDVYGRFSALGFSIGGKGYVGFGGHTGFPQDGLFMYDPSTDSWTQQASLGIRLMNAVAVTAGNKAYLGIGSTDQTTNGYTNSFFEYDPVTNTYTAKTDFPGAGRYGAVGVAINNKIYIGLGNSATYPIQPYNDFWQYDPATDIWTRKGDAPLSLGGIYPIAFSLDDSTTYVCSGPPGGSRTVLWIYNAHTDSWTQKNDLPFNFSWGTCTMVIGSNAYVINGWDQNWLYNPSSDSWTQKAFFTSRMLGVSFVIGNKGYFGLGSGIQLEHVNHYITTDWWQFNP